METPEHERRAIEEYLRSQSDSNFEIEHVEKLASEYVLGGQYDVWDAHTNEGRWWVITNPTNLYSQQHIKSMDVALSFHIGLMMRVIAPHNLTLRRPVAKGGAGRAGADSTLQRPSWSALSRLRTTKRLVCGFAKRF